MVDLVPEIQRRYLATFRVSRIPHRFADVLVLGSGVAGLSAALSIAEDPAVQVLLVAKDSLEESNTRWAQGGVAAVLAPDRTEDSLEAHMRDTHEAAAGLADDEAVRVTVTEGVERVRELISLGAEFDRDESGELQFTREGGHSAPRILHRGDTTGQELERTLLDAVKRGRGGNIQRARDSAGGLPLFARLGPGLNRSNELRHQASHRSGST